MFDTTKPVIAHTEGLHLWLPFDGGFPRDSSKVFKARLVRVAEGNSQRTDRWKLLILLAQKPSLMQCYDSELQD